MLKVEYTEQEANAALTLYNVALKAIGIEAAEAVLVLAKKLKDAAEAAKAPQAPEAPVAP